MSADEVLLRLGEQARGNLGEFVQVNDETGDVMIDLREAKRKRRLHLLKSYQEPSARSGPKIEMYDAQAALVHLGKHLGLFVDRHEVTGPNGGPLEAAVRIYLPDNGRDDHSAPEGGSGEIPGEPG